MSKKTRNFHLLRIHRRIKTCITLLNKKNEQYGMILLSVASYCNMCRDVCLRVSRGTIAYTSAIAVSALRARKRIVSSLIDPALAPLSAKLNDAKKEAMSNL